jgi:hypothetical protein
MAAILNFFKKKPPPSAEVLENTKAFSQFKGMVPLQRV